MPRAIKSFERLGSFNVDLSAAVRSRLSPQLLEKFCAIEAVLKEPVVFFEDRPLDIPDGTVRLAPEHITNLSVIGEEIMQLHRWTAGYSVIDRKYWRAGGVRSRPDEPGRAL